MVLDCGVGTAAFSLALARKMAAPVQLDGVDIAPAMLRQARWALQRESLNAQLHCGDMRHLPFADQTSDLVMSAHMVERLPAPLSGLREMAL